MWMWMSRAASTCSCCCDTTTSSCCSRILCYNDDSRRRCAARSDCSTASRQFFSGCCVASRPLRPSAGGRYGSRMQRIHRAERNYSLYWIRCSPARRTVLNPAPADYRLQGIPIQGQHFSVFSMMLMVVRVLLVDIQSIVISELLLLYPCSIRDTKHCLLFVCPSVSCPPLTQKQKAAASSN